MTRRVGNVLVIEAEPPQQCDLCGLIAELRPYGPHREVICYACITSTIEMEDIAIAHMRERMRGVRAVLDYRKRQGGLSV